MLRCAKLSTLLCTLSVVSKALSEPFLLLNLPEITTAIGRRIEPPQSTHWNQKGSLALLTPDSWGCAVHFHHNHPQPSEYYCNIHLALLKWIPWYFCYSTRKMCLLRVSNICKEGRLLNGCGLGVAVILPSPRVKKYRPEGAVLIGLNRRAAAFQSRLLIAAGSMRSPLVDLSSPTR